MGQRGRTMTPFPISWASLKANLGPLCKFAWLGQPNRIVIPFTLLWKMLAMQSGCDSNSCHRQVHHAAVPHHISLDLLVGHDSIDGNGVNTQPWTESAFPHNSFTQSLFHSCFDRTRTPTSRSCAQFGFTRRLHASSRSQRHSCKSTFLEKK